ncbi:MAG: hypothetical protein HPY69_09610 [Armatimonadetes bacterium]|nr:hypothetical protein [Armatimonadota bacterium]
MPTFSDGPASPAFAPVALPGNVTFRKLPDAALSPALREALPNAPRGEGVAFGLPFRLGRPVLLTDRPVTVKLGELRAQWLVFMHTSDLRHGDPDVTDDPHNRGQGRLGEVAARYVVIYADGTEVVTPIRRRYEVGMFGRGWGENCFAAVAHRKPIPVPANHEHPTRSWGQSQTRVDTRDGGPWVNWLWAWENPTPNQAIAALRFEPVSGRVLVFGLSAGKASANPLRWEARRKAVLTLDPDSPLVFVPDDNGLLPHLQLDLG